MINPIPYLSIANPLLRGSLPPNLLNPLLNTSLSSNLGCWGQNPPQETQLVPLTYIECQQVIRKIPIGDKGAAPLIFSRSAGAGFEVPDSWHQGRCAVMIDVDGADVQETSTFVTILNEARRIMEKCVIKPPHLGGRALVGEQDLLEIVVFGFDPELGAEIWHHLCDAQVSCKDNRSGEKDAPSEARL